MHVIATAGHVDHGKSTLVRALTGIETDRWAEEKKRGLTIDLGFAWCELPSGRGVSFVDVPGHERFIGNMLAGLGPVPIVMFVVAADEGWREQSSDHRDAVKALGIEHGIIAITRADRAPDNAAAVLAQTRTELAGTGLAQAPGVIVSAVTGEGIDELRAQVDALVAQVPAPDTHASVRLWIDRSFTISGAGTVVTGTLGAGCVQAGDELLLVSHHGGEPRLVGVRGVQSRGQREKRVMPVSRAALNLRGVDAESIHRGDVLLTPGTHHLTRTVDVRSVSGEMLDAVPRETLIHVGTAAVSARVRPLGGDHARLSFPHSLPLVVGDRMVLRGSEEKAVRGGVRVLDVDPPQLRRRGSSRARAGELATMSEGGDYAAQVQRRGVVRREDLTQMGIVVPEPGRLAAGIGEQGPWLFSAGFIDSGRRLLTGAVAESSRKDPLNPGLPRAAALALIEVPDAQLLDMVVKAASLAERDGRIIDPAHKVGLGAAEAGIAQLEKRLSAAPFAAPEAYDLDALTLGPKELAAAAKQGRILRLAEGVVLLPQAPALAMRELARLEQPFTTSQARAALGTTRRVVIPLLEHLDSRGWTRRIDAGHREVVR